MAIREENKKRQAKAEAGRRGAAAAWNRLTHKERKEKIAKMTAARLAAKAEKAEQLVNGEVVN